MERTSGLSPASFRDPDGAIFIYNDFIYRRVNDSVREDFDFFQSSKLYKKLVDDRKIVSFKEVELPECELCAGAYKTLLPEQLPFISYPYEWSFDQVKDSALLTLDIALDALSYNMILKDANPYNIQLVKGEVKHIDSLSFERYEEGKPWVAYRQYCEMFLSILILMSKVDPSFARLLSLELSGMSLNLVNKIVPLRQKIDCGYLLHIWMQSKAQNFYSQRVSQHREYRLAKDSLKSLLQNLRSTTAKLTLPNRKSFWYGYYKDNNYTDSSFAEKKEIIEKYIKSLKPKSVWDLGANTGIFSEIASSYADKVIALDNDHDSVNALYNKIRKTPNGNIYPLVADLVNPTPGIGWMNVERGSLISRSDSDLILALALIHHLAIVNNTPFHKISELFSRIGGSLIVEFVDKSDSQVQRLLANREDIFEEYSQQGFEAVFSEQYRIIDKVRFGNRGRVLYFMKPKK